MALIAPCIQVSLALAQQKNEDPPQASPVLQDSAGQAVQQPGPQLKKQDNKKKTAGTPDYSIRVKVPLVTLDVSVLTPNGYSVPELTKENFRVFEDGVPQTITSFSRKETAVTAVLLVEFSVQSQDLEYPALRACARFAQGLKPDDWTAMILFDREPRIVQDFTQDSRALEATLDATRIPLLREANLFDALDDTLDRLQTVDGRKYIILIASGQDSFSKDVLDDVYKKIESARDTVIYALDTGTGMPDRQAINQMRTFARMTGGRVYFPTSLYEYGDVFREVQQSMHNRYTLSYHPTHSGQNGAEAWHKIKVQVVAPANSVPGSKEDYGRKFQVIARDGYRAEKADSK
ncbi:MAG TPA: VWA domain-containing protein [Candidatus Angelobacter sp.]